jgi:hypothetical protein
VPTVQQQAEHGEHRDKGNDEEDQDLARLPFSSGSKHQ